jgi:hypothetical protein
MARRRPRAGGIQTLSDVLKASSHHFRIAEIVELFTRVSQVRVDAIAQRLNGYISVNLPAAFERREGLADYRSNPYVLLTSANVMNLADPERFADFLFNSKLYMALETSFGKSIEGAGIEQYPIGSDVKWGDPPEKRAEFAALDGLGREERARRRVRSVWREVDRSVVLAGRRYLTSIKSGPNTINDTQVQGMTQAIIDHHRAWFDSTTAAHPEVRELDIVIGLTYGTDRTTNNKDNQILIKLLAHGFEEADREREPGVLIDSATRSIRVYRRIGQDFWAFIGSPADASSARFVFLEVLLGLTQALSMGMGGVQTLEDRINARIRGLSAALARLQFPRESLPDWIREDFSENQLFWFMTAITAFYDEGV